ncbi:MAG: FAD-binding oxidoreductase [Aestuariivirga sp.]|uniref:NAD(P)/FAD-dependent oxidoreductase n=1 Tax=Aestuariivirga sp. TaxID=2650926 RepID=UPI0025BDC2D5|nr:FAD-binding oxidoreductase [Aestuariivirga sp.]MCA3561666.1 FAD-binding oxidoreductase [Aestuariivirga sp.]
MKTYDVVIVGGGVVGSASAYYLRKNGFTGSIAIVEKDTSWAHGCTARSAGGLRQQFSTPENIHLSKFGVTLVKNLKQEFGPDADIGFKEQGYLICATPEGLLTLEENHAVQIAHGADNVLLRGEELAARFPWLVTEGIAAGCFGLSGEGWVDPYMFAALFRKAAIAQGAELVQGEVTGVTRDGHRITGLTLASGEAIACGTLVNAAGTGAGRLAAMAGIELPVGPRKRYVYVLDCPAATEALHLAPLTVIPGGVYFRPEGRNFLAGLSPEEHQEPDILDWEVDYSWFEETIWPALAGRVPLFEAIKVISAWVGHYDYNALDQNAVIGPNPEVTNFLFANGFSGHGLQQGPAAGNAISELVIDGRYKTIDLTRFGFARIRNNRPLFEKNVI